MNTLSKILIACSVFALSACDSENDPENKDFVLQILHASADAPPVNVFFDGAEALSGIDYKQGSGFVTLEEGTYEIRVDGILPGGNATVIGPANLTFERGNIYTVAAVGSVANIEPVVIAQADEAVSAGAIRLFLLHGVPGPLELDVYVTAPGADLSATAPTGTFDFKDTLGPVEVAAGDYQVRVTPAGDPDTLAYDSGKITLTAGTDLRLAAVPGASAGPAALTLVGLAPAGSVEFLDARTPTALRVGHLSADTVFVDVINEGT